MGPARPQVNTDATLCLIIGWIELNQRHGKSRLDEQNAWFSDRRPFLGRRLGFGQGPRGLAGRGAGSRGGHRPVAARPGAHPRGVHRIQRGPRAEIPGGRQRRNHFPRRLSDHQPPRGRACRPGRLHPVESGGSGGGADRQRPVDGHCGPEVETGIGAAIRAGQVRRFGQAERGRFRSGDGQSDGAVTIGHAGHH